jgi:general secretion pathway protein G
MKHKSDTKGFTLIELMVAVVIMAILMGLVIGLSGLARRKSVDAQARAELQTLATALEEYKLVAGTYPASLNILTNQNQAISRIEIPLREKVRINDPWSRPYIFTNITRYSYTLYSQGALTDITDDDIYVGSVQ